MADVVTQLASASATRRACDRGKAASARGRHADRGTKTKTRQQIHDELDGSRRG